MGSNGGMEQQASTGALHATVGALHEQPLTSLSDDEVITAMREVEQCVRMLTSVQHRLLVEATERSLPARHGAKSMKNFLMQTLRLASADAGARVQQAAWVATFHDMAGEPVPPRLPHTAQALAGGEISTDHARGIATVINRVPRGATNTDHEAAEQILADFARTGSPDDISTVGDRILAHLDPDGRLTTDTDRARVRGIMIGRQRPDGMSPIRGDIDPQLRALLDPLLATYARPGMCNPDDPHSPLANPHGAVSNHPAPPSDSMQSDLMSDSSRPVPGCDPSGTVLPQHPETLSSPNQMSVSTGPLVEPNEPSPASTRPNLHAPQSGSEVLGGSPPDHLEIDRAILAEAAARDHRSTAQRNHDALKTLLTTGIITERLATHRGLPVTTVLTMTVDDLEQNSGVATTATGGTIPISDALPLAERSQPWLAVFDHAGRPLHLGRTKRLASRDQRLALIATLKGCTRPGCAAPASLCAVHHVLDYRKHGTTDITNLTLACDSCHALVHDGPGGWKTRTQPAGAPYAGRTAWIAPPHIDPTQTPRINHRHHAAELLAEAVSGIHLRNERLHEKHQQWLRTRSVRKPAQQT